MTAELSRVHVIGAGAIGSLFAGYLSAAGLDVTLIERRREVVRTVSENGLLIEGVRGELRARPRIVERVPDSEPSDLVLVCTKAYDTAAALAQHSALFKNCAAALSLQNGIGNCEALCALIGIERVLAGTTTMGGFVIEPGRVRHAGEGDTLIGAAAGGGSQLAGRIAAALSAAGIKTGVTDDVQRLLWEKLCVNAAINPLTALLRAPNGALLQSEQAQRLMLDAVDEVVAVAERIGIALERETMRQRALDVARLTGRNRSSMLADVLAGKRTEIDYINGAVARLAAQHNVPAPINALLSDLVRALEQVDPAAG